MTNAVLLYIAAALPVGWGIAHLFPTRKVVAAFGDISTDNKRIITMEWITEGLALIFIGALLAVVTVIDRTSTAAVGVYWCSVVMLNAMSVLSLFTGFRINFLPFKLCPVIFTGTSVIVVLGTLL